MTNDTHFTIKPLTTSIDIVEQRKLMAAWHTNGLTDAQIRKMLMLYFGEPAWMNLAKLYDCNIFGQIAKGLKFHNRHDFVETLLKCPGFGFIWRDDLAGRTDKNLIAFYTPIWHVANEKDMQDEGKESDENSDENDENERPSFGYIDNNIYNKKKNNKKKNISHHVSRNQDARAARSHADSSAERQRAIEASAKTLLHHIATNPDAYAAVVKPVNELTLKMMPELHIDTTAICPTTQATVKFINEHLYPYLLAHSERLMKIHTLEGQSCWLRNLINCEFMQKNIMRAINDTRRHLAQNHTEMLRQCRPKSPYEYEDKASGQRFYDTTLPDGSLRQHRIPEGATPRPSASATWSKFTHKWNP